MFIVECIVLCLIDCCSYWTENTLKAGTLSRLYLLHLAQYLAQGEHLIYTCQGDESCEYMKIRHNSAAGCVKNCGF